MKNRKTVHSENQENRKTRKCTFRKPRKNRKKYIRQKILRNPTQQKMQKKRKQKHEIIHQKTKKINFKSKYSENQQNRKCEKENRKTKHNSLEGKTEILNIQKTNKTKN